MLHMPMRLQCSGATVASVRMLTHSIPSYIGVPCIAAAPRGALRHGHPFGPMQPGPPALLPRVSSAVVLLLDVLAVLPRNAQLLLAVGPAGTFPVLALLIVIRLQQLLMLPFCTAGCWEGR